MSAWAPDLAAPPAMPADADRAVDGGVAIAKRIAALAEMRSAEMAAAERTLEAGMRAAIFDAAEARTIALRNPLCVLEVLGQVVALEPAHLAGADGIEAFDDGCVLRTKAPAAVLATVLGSVGATRKDAPDLAESLGHAINLSPAAKPVVPATRDLYRGKAS